MPGATSRHHVIRTILREGVPGARLLPSAALLLVVALAACGTNGPTPSTTTPTPAPTVAPTPAPSFDPAIVEGMPAADALDDRWGTYVSEREWGNPRQSQGGNGWGMSPLEATRVDYTYAEDGIAAISDDEGEFHVGWAFWDGKNVLVTERLFGLSNSLGDNGETIIDRRTFGANTPTHSYADYRLQLPKPSLDIQQPGATPDPAPTWDVRLENAKVDSDSWVLRSTVTNTGTAADTLQVVLKGWFGTNLPGTVTAAADSLLLDGRDSVVAVSAPAADSFQAEDAKKAINTNLKAGALSGNPSGRIGALAYEVTLAPGETRTLEFGMTEVATATAAEATDDPGAAAAAAMARADAVQPATGAVLERRADEAEALFHDDVTVHQDMYAAALSSLLWAKSYYAWDGAGLDDAWKGKVDAHDVLIMPDKWEYPWLASWDTGFHAVAATLVDPDLGADQLEFLFSDRWQQPDGHIPCAEWVMDVECPPLFGWSALRVAEAYDAAGRTTDADAFLAGLYPGLARQFEYWQEVNSVGGDLYAGGFLGMDNLPRGRNKDGSPAAQADGSAWMAAFAGHLATIAERLGKDDEAAAWRGERERIAAAVNANLWSEEEGFYFDADVNGLRTTVTYSGLVPLIAGIVPPDRLPRVLDAIRDPNKLLSDHGLRSMSAAEYIYTPGLAGRGVNSNWRGPIWLPYSYLVIEALDDVDPALAADLRERTIATVESNWQATGRIWEYFDGNTGVGLGADAQTGWTATIANLIHEAYAAP